MDREVVNSLGNSSSGYIRTMWGRKIEGCFQGVNISPEMRYKSRIFWRNISQEVQMSENGKKSGGNRYRELRKSHDNYL
jgi:hypothetical protein